MGGRGTGYSGQQPNIQQLMKQAQKMQEQMEAAQAELALTEVTGTAGGGLVTATVTGTGDLTAITIDPTAVDPDDSRRCRIWWWRPCATPAASLTSLAPRRWAR